MLNPFLPTILIAWVNQNHYELLLQKNMDLDDYPIEMKIIEDEHIFKNTAKESLNSCEKNNEIYIKRIINFCYK